MGLQIVQWNCRIILNKQVLLTLPPFSILMSLCFRRLFYLDKIFHIPGWIVYHQDRQGHLGGGLVIAVSSYWLSSHIIFPNFNLDSEILGVKVFKILSL